MNTSSRVLTTLAGVLAAVGCSLSAGTPVPAEADKPFHKDLLKAAAEYKEWGRVDDEMRWAPWLCRVTKPGQVQFSASKDGQTHGQKLYSLFARNRDAYWSLQGEGKVSTGQVVVKQSWIPEEVTDPKERGSLCDDNKIIHTPPRGSRQPASEGDHFYPYVTRGDKVFKASKQADLFIMLKLDPETPNTDAGWVYGTVTPDGKTVTSAGKVESCMNCHREAKNERLLGLWKEGGGKSQKQAPGGGR
jgi:hypothetical protein